MAASESDVDIVFLLPGFLGFEQFNEYAYFGDRFGTALRASLAPRVHQNLQVVAISLPPTSSLEERQLALGKTLIDRAYAVQLKRKVDDIRAIHLVGHSTGGVDAQLLTRERSLSGRAWSEFRSDYAQNPRDLTWLRSRLRSVISLASPHQGTCLANDPLAKLVALDSPLEFLHRAPEAAGEALHAAWQILKGIPTLTHDEELRSLLPSVIDSPVAWRFFGDILRSRALIDDLSPQSALKRADGELGGQLTCLRRSFVTIAGVTPTRAHSALGSAKQVKAGQDRAKTAGGEHSQESRRERRALISLLLEPAVKGPDPLFLLLSQLASGRSTECLAGAPLLPHSLEAVEAGRVGRTIAGDPSLVPQQLDAAMNDGVVNSARQLIDPRDPNEFAGLVVADHFDVVGHYDRALFVTDPKTGETTEQNKIAGLLHSGSAFRDDQFFALIERMGDALLPAFD
jgi:hypothetical protein